MSHPGPVVVTAKNIKKSFGDFKVLDDLSFEIKLGAIVGLIGPNGAGKTTTLKSLLGLTDFDGGLDVLGKDPRKGRHEIMQAVCFISDVGVLPRWLKVNQALDFVQAIHPGFSRDKAEQLLAATDIPKNKKVKQLSKGMVTQLHLALVLAIQVDLLVLDEPTLGLDILHRKEFYDRLLNECADNKTSIIISTHQVEEIESLLTDLLFIDAGRIVLDVAMNELADKYTEVIVAPEGLELAQQIGPLSSRDVAGKKVMIFENRDQQALARLGEVCTPSVADLFVAKMQGGKGR
ncbi:MAG: ABC transporter ATP-binding protein [Pseudomonadales bacterium]|nr:ABC transporter ATP-binding protein [Pseudomonadales bacterium]